jgi:hypothetical protein
MTVTDDRNKQSFERVIVIASYDGAVIIGERDSHDSFNYYLFYNIQRLGL